MCEGMIRIWHRVGSAVGGISLFCALCRLLAAELTGVWTASLGRSGTIQLRGSQRGFWVMHLPCHRRPCLMAHKSACGTGAAPHRRCHSAERRTLPACWLVLVSPAPASFVHTVCRIPVPVSCLHVICTVQGCLGLLSLPPRGDLIKRGRVLETSPE